MKRRNFLAALLAPILAKFAPKPDPAHDIKYACEIGTGWIEGQLESCTTAAINSTGRDYIFAVGSPEPELLYWSQLFSPQYYGTMVAAYEEDIHVLNKGAQEVFRLINADVERASLRLAEALARTEYGAPQRLFRHQRQFDARRFPA